MKKHSLKAKVESQSYKRRVVVSLIEELGRNSTGSLRLSHGWNGTLEAIIGLQSRER